MFTVRGKKRTFQISGFTLLEIMLAVGILGLMALAIFRFVQSNMLALRVSSDTAFRDSQYDGLRDFLTAEWQNLGSVRSKIYGEPFKLKDRERDWVRWTSGAGQGLLTRYAPGDFTVTLGLQPESEKSDRLDLGLLRKPTDDSDTGKANETWVPLIKNVSTLQISYFSPNLNNWIDRWSNTSQPPWLVKLTVGRTDSAVPWEVIIPLRRTPY
ncbi:MAG TPA: prepilin-type N-terminal cleavage/methylation domain-containing protein [Candidatus Udaeobacter sp.]|jgi:prepilin-type N-terminal cleavage/methylation domain-containing protein|nr:prepilin-type N-terminal cleavage/methylation domain-containing protein [Candidatus Udaeobacter sp.]